MTRFITTTKVPPSDSARYTVVLLSSLPIGKSMYGTPVSLYPINSKETVLDIQYQAIKTVFPKSDIYIITGFNTLQVVNRRPLGLRVLENQNYEHGGEVEELRLGLNIINTPSIITISGNMIFNDEALNQIRTKHSSILVDSTIENDNIVGTITDNAKLENISFGIPNKWCGISHFTGKELESLKSLANIKSKANLCMFELINTLVHNRNGIIYTINHIAGYIKRIEK